MLLSISFSNLALALCVHCMEAWTTKTCSTISMGIMMKMLHSQVLPHIKSSQNCTWL